jgi:hypothetical protein
MPNNTGDKAKRERTAPQRCDGIDEIASRCLAKK